jgi:hypothetical protein
MRGATVKPHDHVSQMSLGQGAVFERGSLNDTVHYRSGILIFSHGQKLLHANRRALELTGHLHQAEMGTVGEFHSAPVRELRNAIQAAMDHRIAANNWEPFKLKRVICEGRRKFLVCGFGLADRSSHDDSRIVLVLDELGLRQKGSEPQR